MAYSKTRQFWAWFRKNAHLYHDMHKKNKKEAAFLHNEMDIHLRAIHSRLSYSFLYSPNEPSVLVISARLNEYYFPKAEKVIAMAPPIPEWNTVALFPQSHPMLGVEKCFGDLFNYDTLMFLPTGKDARGRLSVTITAELFQKPTERMEDCVYHILCNLLGERVFASELGEYTFQCTWSLTPTLRLQMRHILELPAYLQEMSPSNIVITREGKMEIG